MHISFYGVKKYDIFLYFNQITKTCKSAKSSIRFLKSQCHQFCLFRVCQKRRGPQMLESIRAGVGDEWNGRQTSETNFVFYPPVKILLSSQKLRFGIFDFPKESFLYKFKCLFMVRQGLSNDRTFQNIIITTSA